MIDLKQIATKAPATVAPIAKPAAPEQMPAAGGSYVRLPDGTLQPANTATPE
jgi:hypothetical protein